MSQIKKLYLHIGRAKTGTTKLQKTLTANRKSLAQSGYCYPKMGIGGPESHSHVLLALACLNAIDKDKKEILDQKGFFELREQFDIETEPFSKVIVSCEGFQNILEDTSTRLNFFFHRETTPNLPPKKRIYHINTICYLREFLDYAISSYSQRVQSTNMSCNFDQFCAHFGAFDLRAFLNFWEKFSDTTEFISYYSASFIQGRFSPTALANDFSRRIDFQLMQEQNEINHNPSIAGNLLLFKLILNRIAPHKPEYNLALIRLARKDSRLRGDFYLSAYSCKRLRSIYQNYNEIFEAAVGYLFIKDFSKSKPFYDKDMWHKDIEMFLEEPEFSQFKTMPEFWEQNPAQWCLKE